MRSTAAVDSTCMNFFEKGLPSKKYDMWMNFHPKTFESEKQFTHESILRFLGVGVRSVQP